MDTKGWAQITNMMIECTQALFEAFGVQLHHGGVAETAMPMQDVTLAVVGFAGSQMCGSLLLNTSNELLERSHPLSGTTFKATPEDLRDWSGELANQLLGRIKKELLGYGITIQLSTPTTLSGIKVHIGPSLSNAECKPHHFETNGAWIQIRFEALAEPNVTLDGMQSATPIPSMEGDLFLF